MVVPNKHEIGMINVVYMKGKSHKGGGTEPIRVPGASDRARKGMSNDIYHWR
jgi:hypothetical protein